MMTQTPSRNASGNGAHILIVDDEEMLVMVTESMLEELGYVTTAFSSGKAALDAFTQAPETYDLVLTDQAMPGMTGVELAQHILKIRTTTPIILCSGFASEDNETVARDIGISRVVTKPVSLEELAAQIRDVINTK